MKRVFIPLFVAVMLLFSNNAAAEEAYFYDTAGKTVFISSFKGKPTVLFFYKQNCAICLKMLVNLDKFRPTVADEFNIIPIMIENANTNDARKLFIRQDIRTLPIYLDKDQVLTSMLDFHVTPMTILLNKNGKITKKIQGSLNWAGPFFAEELQELKGKQSNGELK
jgi:thiol-disulfide isomerase/thioredoxin